MPEKTGGLYRLRKNSKWARSCNRARLQPCRKDAKRRRASAPEKMLDLK
jgi:hypothetical protein